MDTCMLSGRYLETAVTRAFTGHPARALRNRFTDTYSTRAPIGYPAVHHLTAPIRPACHTPTRHPDSNPQVTPHP